MNRVILVGRLTADPELKQTPNGISVCSFSIAVNRPYSSKNGDRQADFINIVAWRAQAEFVSKYFAKGNQIGIDGSIQTRNYTDKDGNKRTAFEVVADNISFIESKAASQQNRSNDYGNDYSRPQPQHQADPAPVTYSNGDAADFAEIDDDDLPF